MALVDGQVGFGQFQIQQIVAACQVQRTGFDRRTLALGQEVGDVLGAEGVIGQGILQGAGDFVRSVALGQGDDLLDVMLWVDALSERWRW